MQTFFLVLHLIIATFLIASILLQSSDDDGLKGLSGSSNIAGMMSARSASSFATKFIYLLCALFFINSIILGNLAIRESKKAEALVEQIEKKELEVPIAE